MQIPISATILLVAATIAVIVGRSFPVQIRQSLALSFFILALLIAAVGVATGTTPGIDEESAGVRSPFVNDALARSEQWLTLAIGFLAGIAIFDSPQTARPLLEAYGFLLAALAGILLVAQANDFLSLGLSLEIVMLALIPFQADSASPSKNETAGERGIRKSADAWFAMMFSGWFWLGVALLSNATSATNFDAVRSVLTDAYGPMFDETKIGSPSKLVYLSISLIVISLFARMGTAPLHFGWMRGLRNERTAMYGASLIFRQLVTMIAFNRLLGYTTVGLGSFLSTLIISLCLASFVLSAILALRGQLPGIESIPNLLASLALSQSTWLAVGQVIAVVELDHQELRWGTLKYQTEMLALNVYCQLASALSIGGIYWALAHLQRVDRKILFLEDLKGLIKISPAASITLLIATASAIGIPGTVGFLAHWFVLLSGSSLHARTTSNFYTPHAGLRFTMFVGILATLATATLVFRLFREILLELPLGRPRSIGGRGPIVASVVTAIAIVILGIVPQAVLVPLKSVQPPHIEGPKAPEHQPRGSGKTSVGLKAMPIFGAESRVENPVREFPQAVSNRPLMI